MFAQVAGSLPRTRADTKAAICGSTGERKEINVLAGLRVKDKIPHTLQKLAAGHQKSP